MKNQLNGPKILWLIKANTGCPDVERTQSLERGQITHRKCSIIQEMQLLMIFTRIELTYTGIATLKSKVTRAILCKTLPPQLAVKASVQSSSNVNTSNVGAAQILWSDKAAQFYSDLLKKWLEDDNTIKLALLSSHMVGQGGSCLTTDLSYEASSYSSQEPENVFNKPT